ncbi:MAG: tRNA epoxyqueuosine(34) reductase QueG [Verrucomicrobia bacterium]|nr:tRNA epoxyqueuosine(34) reductase QueG [Verrucomicrobiota bacterium]
MPLSAEQTLRNRARALGFDDCRFTTAEAPETAPVLRDWLAAGCHGDMAYLTRTASKRADPRRVLPGARSVITLAASYARVEPHPAPPPPPPSSSADPCPPARIARYAQFADYHPVLETPLHALAETVNTLGGPLTRSLAYVDTGPVLERDLAQRAGIGFVGKHTGLVSRSLGNWFFLAEILTTLDLRPDPPEPNRCGTCTRCLAACPTAALIAPFRLDARRCIAYLTIEFKGSIPPELRPHLGNRIYGCDDCLAACPWSRFTRPGRLMPPHAQPALAAPDLVGLLDLDDAAFHRRFAGTPLLRAQRRGLRRNVCVALGNTGDERALPALRRAASDPDAMVAEHARWAIDRIEQRLAPPTRPLSRNA